MKEKEKQERKEKNEARKLQKTNEIAGRSKPKRKKQQITADESSETSCEIILESEDEGGNWDQPPSDISEIDEEEKAINKEGLKKEDFVIIIYENKYYPGQIKKVKANQKAFLVSTMVQSGLNFRWPEKRDNLWYFPDQIITKIRKPKEVNSRGSYIVPEMTPYIE